MIRWMVLMLLMAWPAAAGPVLSPEMAERIRAQPDRFLETGAALIFGFGAEGRFDAAAGRQVLALDRARLRQRELRLLLLADLDDDGAVTAAELAVLMRAEGAGPRGRLALAFARGDADGDGVVGPAELMAEARRVADLESRAMAEMVAAVLACDLDGDGSLDLAELRRAVALLAGGA